MSGLTSLSAFIRGNFTFLRLFVNYGRGVNQRSYLADTLGAEVKAVMGRQGLDLGTNPVDVRPVSSCFTLAGLVLQLTVPAAPDLPQRRCRGGDAHRPAVAAAQRRRQQARLG